MDPDTLQFLNRQHLARAMATPDGVDALVKRIHLTVKSAFPLR